MPFDSYGRFMPQQAMTIAPTAARQPLAQSSAQSMYRAQPAAQVAQAFRPDISASTAAPQSTMSYGAQPFNRASAFMDRRNLYALEPEYRQPVAPTAPNPNPPQQPQAAAPPANRGPGFDIGAWEEPGTRVPVAPTYAGPQQYQQYGMSQLGAPPPRQAVGNTSVTQMAGRGNAQSVQNYLSALGQSGAGTNNANMNYQGQLGADAQAGFQGFGQNGYYGPTYIPQGYTGPMQAGLSYQNNGAYTNQNYNIGNYAYQGGYGQMGAPQLANMGGVRAGGTGGVAGQGQYVIPEPWRNIANSDQGTPGSLRANSGDEQYTAGTYNRPKEGKQPGAYTPGAMYTDRPPEGTYDPNDGKTTSDVRAKEHISDAKGELQEFLDHLGVYSYEYKDKTHGEGRYISPMAQEFEKSKLGAQAVETGPDGLKKVNYGRLIGVQSAALALLNHKYNALEEKFNTAVKTNLKNRKK